MLTDQSRTQQAANCNVVMGSKLGRNCSPCNPKPRSYHLWIPTDSMLSFSETPQVLKTDPPVLESLGQLSVFRYDIFICASNDFQCILKLRSLSVPASGSTWATLGGEMFTYMITKSVRNNREHHTKWANRTVLQELLFIY